jgi:hypothetical protein
MTSGFPLFNTLPTTTIVPQDENLFLPYFNRQYEDIANAVNSKDNNFYTIAIGSTATNIPGMSNFGAFIVCVSGELSTLPTLTASLCKADSTAAGSIAVLGSQVGTGAWAGNALTITSTTTNFQIAHNRTGVTANFNIRIIGTQ